MHIRLSKEELYTRGKLLDDMMDACFDAAILVDNQCYIIHHSKGAEKVIGMTSEELIGKHINVVNPESGFEKVIKTGQSSYGNVRFIKGKTYITNMFPIFDGTEVIGALGVVLFRTFSVLKKVLTSPNLIDGENNENDLYDRIARLDSYTSFDDYISQCQLIKQVIHLCRKAAKTDYPVLITGETGVGKELLANAIHSESNRYKKAPFVKINCTAIPTELLESELFGHEKGAFTGAITSKKGKFELAENGSILLDEIGDIEPRLQSKLLRVIEEKEFERVGGNKLIPLKARIIASTNRDLEELCKKEIFRADLYYRLCTFEIHVPPLRERPEDIPLLLDFFMKKNNISINLAPEAMDLLMRYDWPGNVRQLRNVVNRFMILDDKDTIESADIMHILKYPITAAKTHEPQSDSLEEKEKSHIIDVLHKAEMNITLASKRLKISRKTLYNKIKKYQIEL